MATAPGATGNWIYVGNGQWSPAGQSSNEGQTDWYALEPGSGFTGPDANIVNTVGRYGGTADEIARMLTGMSAAQYQSTYGVPLDYTAAARGITPYTSGTGTTHIGSRPTLSALQASGINTAANPNLTAWDQKMTQQAQQQAQSINDVNSQGVTAQQLALAALAVYGGGYLMGTGLGAAQGLGSFGTLLANPSMTGVNLGAAGALGGEAAGAAGWGVNQGTGMTGWEWLDAVEPGGMLGSGVGDIPLEFGAGLGSGGGTTGWEWLDTVEPGGTLGEGIGDIPLDFALPPGSSSDYLSYLSKILSASKALGGGGTGGGGGGADPWGVNQLLGGAGGLFGGGGGLGDILGKSLGLAPVLAALNYGYNQTGFDTGRLEDLYGQYNPQAMAGQYDLNTGLGRNELTSSLGRRGVLGSSFGNMDLANYNTARDIGRSQLISGAVQPAAGIAGQILGANIAEQKLKNDLIGQGARAVGQIFGGGSPGGGGYAGTTPTATAGGGNDWWNSILRAVSGGGGTQMAGNPLDVWNI